MNKFEQFLNEANPELVTICGIQFNQVEALKLLSMDAYELLKEAWIESEEPRVALRLVSA